MIKAVIYDFDGTLADTLSAHYDAYAYSLKKCGVRADRKTIIANCFNRTDSDAAASFEIDVTEFSKHYREQVVKNFKHVKLYPGALSTCKSIDLPLAIGTSREAKEILPMLDRLKLRELCKTIVTRDKVKRGKAEIFRKVCANLNVKPSETIVVGDSAADLEAANEINAKSVLFYPDEHRDYYDFKALKKHKPTFVIKNHKEIIDILRKMK